MSPIARHVFLTYALDDDQAPIVLRIFKGYAEDLSMKKIAAALNTEGITASTGGSWDVSGIRYILLNEAYRGWRIWNKTKKIRKPDGKKTYRQRPREEWIILEDAHPVIVDDELWAEVETVRIRKKRFHPKNGNQRTAFSQYLLTGLVKCAECGHNFIVHKARGSHPTRRHFYYRCGYHERRGNAVCKNNTTVKRDRLEDAVVHLLRNQILTKQNVQALVDGVGKAWKTQEQEDPNKDLKRIERDLKKTDRELGNLVQAIKSTGISGALRDELERCEKRKATLAQTTLKLQQSQPQALSLPSEQAIAAALGNLSKVLASGAHRDRRTILEDNIEEIQIQPNGDALLKVNPAGLLPLPEFPLGWCREPDLNRHDR